jgi:uncharacterized membrane protein
MRMMTPEDPAQLHDGARVRSLAPPGLVLGLGLGGFLDGIVIHQMLGWHHMLSGWYPLTSPHRERINMVGDGLFHLLCWLLVVAGVVLLVRAAPAGRPGVWRRLAGWTVAGWGVFNVVEGVIDHLVLGVHHVHPQSHRLAYDLGFLVLGLLLAAAGWAAARGASRDDDRSASRPQMR